jgi:hypothetical protein
MRWTIRYLIDIRYYLKRLNNPVPKRVILVCWIFGFFLQIWYVVRLFNLHEYGWGVTISILLIMNLMASFTALRRKRRQEENEMVQRVIDS